MSADVDTNTRRRVEVALIAVDSDAATRFVSLVCGPGSQVFAAQKETVHFTLSVYSETLAGAVGSLLEEAHAAILLATHLDVTTLKALRAAARLVAAKRPGPIDVVLFRPDGVSEFKMSCPDCGQKLWVRDLDVGRNGRCPQCKKVFVLPAQLALLKSSFGGISPLVFTAASGDMPDACRAPIRDLVTRLHSPSA